MANADSMKINSNFFEWKQPKDTLFISVLEIPFVEDEKAITNMITELISKNIMFSIKLSSDSQFLIVYDFSKTNKKSTDIHNLVHHLSSNYSLKLLNNPNDFFTPPIKKIVQKDSTLEILFEDGTKKYFLTYILSSVNKKATQAKKAFTKLTKSLIQTDVFSIIITQFPNTKSGDTNYPKWGIFFISEDYNLLDIKRKNQVFCRFVKANSTKIDSKLSLLLKKSISRHLTNFRFLVPWIKHEGAFSDVIKLNDLLRKKQPKDHNYIIEKKLEEPLSPNIPPSLLSKTVHLNKPFPSVKAEVVPDSNFVNVQVGHNIIEVQKSENSQDLCTNIDDVIIPSTQPLNKGLDNEFIKHRVNSVLKSFDFKETIIFEENNDLVLRKGSFYIFVRIFKGILNQTQAYEILDELSSIAGLRNKFICITIADVLENGAFKILNEYNVLFLSYNDLLNEVTLKSKICECLESAFTFVHSH